MKKFYELLGRNVEMLAFVFKGSLLTIADIVVAILDVKGVGILLWHLYDVPSIFIQVFVIMTLAVVQVLFFWFCVILNLSIMGLD